MKTLRENVDVYLKNHNMTMTEFSQRSNISRMTLNNIKYYKPSLKTYYKLSTMMNIDIEKLIHFPIKK